MGGDRQNMSVGVRTRCRFEGPFCGFLELAEANMGEWP